MNKIFIICSKAFYKDIPPIKEKLEENLDSESYKLISQTQTSPEFKFKFKLLEIFSQVELFTAKN